jgi:hypothetical protein
MSDHRFLEKVQKWIIIFSLPFWYGAITRLPFIYFVIHMRIHFELDWLLIGCYVGAYQATRVLTNIVAIWWPKLAHVGGTLIGLAGNIIVLTNDTSDKVPFLVGTIIIGFSETMACMQGYLKDFSSKDLSILEHQLKLQYAVVCFAAFFAFGAGGVIYQLHGIRGVAILGSILSSFELLSIILYMILDRVLADGLETTSDAASKQKGNVSIGDSEKGFRNTDGEGRMDENVADLTDSILLDGVDLFSEADIGANSFSYILCITFGMEAITIGYNLAISPVFITEQFDKDPAVIGLMLASGAAFGTIISVLITLTQRGKNFMKNYLPSPGNFVVAMGGISIAVLLAAVPVFPVHIIGLVMLMGWNDFAAILLNEIQGKVTAKKAYLKIGPLGQVIRRSLNVVTAITGPLLYSIGPALPYIVAGIATGVWTIFLYIVIKRRKKLNYSIIRKAKGVDKNDKISKKRTDNRISFCRQEITARLLKRGMIGEKNLKNLKTENSSVKFPIGEADEEGFLHSDDDSEA